MKVLFACLSCVLASLPPAEATTYRSPAFLALSATANGLDSYAERHNGELPKELIGMFDRFPESLTEFEAILGGSISRRLRYFSVGEVANDRGESLLVVTRDQVYEDSREEKGRYVVWTKDGTCRAEWLSETVARTLFQKSGKELEALGVWTQPSTAGIPQMKRPEPADGKRIEKSQAQPDPGTTHPPRSGEVRQNLGAPPSRPVWALMLCSAAFGAFWWARSRRHAEHRR